jgi:hypothetical protein
MSVIPFRHTMAAHCESGALAALLNHRGMNISEPMLFGIGAGIFFAYLRLPALKFPIFAVRSRPGSLRGNIARRLGVTFRAKRFRDPVRARTELAALLDRKVPVAVQTDFFYMEYIPAHLRTHFNAHFVVIFGEENGRFLVSDCYFPEAAFISPEALDRARFAKGDFSPRGLMVYPDRVPSEVNWEKAVRDGIRQAARGMLGIPLPFVGVRGIRLFAKKILSWPDLAHSSEELSHEIMKINLLLEEQGTGGGGFRFMYATFLQEAAKLLGRPEYAELSRRMMDNGDRWRDISLFAARTGRNRDFGKPRLAELSDMIRARADEEQRLFTELKTLTK